MMTIRPFLRRLLLVVSTALLAPGASPCLAAGGASGGSPAFTLGEHTIAGQGWFNVNHPVRSTELEGRPVLLVYWATWCSYCMREVPELNKLQEMYADRGLVIIALTRESPATIASYVRAYGMRYPICAGVPADYLKAIRAIPHCVLLSADHVVVRDGHPKVVIPVLHVLMKKHDRNATPSLAVPGVVPDDVPLGLTDNRPGPADLARVIDLVTDRISRGIAVDDSSLDRVYRFYWGNLPEDGRHGDAEMRHLADTALLSIFAAARNGRDDAVVRSLRAELLRRLQARSPLWADRSAHARYVTYLFPEGAPAAIQSLREGLQREHHPVVRYRLTLALEAIDPSVPRQPEPRSEINEYRKQFEDAKNSWLTRVAGLVSPWSDYQRFENNTVTPILEAARYAPAFLPVLRDAYRAHMGDSAADVLFRSTCLEALNGLIGRFEPSMKPQERIAVGRFVLELLSRPPDKHWELRRATVFTVRPSLFDARGRKRVVNLLSSWLRREEVRAVRPYMEAALLELTSSSAAP